ncbi:glycophorin-A isoform X2 [Puma concolor]|uniref:Glycophorin-A n=1 Tax=Puma concolor TaxID=9696 RepID=A0A6P6HSS2_PUMCO|nr:glycophorin-A isoform X2 [Puma concolor]
MYGKTIILTVLLLSGYSSSQLTTESVSVTHESPVSAMTVQSPHVVTTEALPFNIHGDGLLEHIFSAGEITGIVYAVMAGIIGTILSIAFCIKRLTKSERAKV